MEKNQKEYEKNQKLKRKNKTSLTVVKRQNKIEIDEDLKELLDGLE